MLQICCYLTSWTSSGNLTICMQKVTATACIQATNQTSIASPIWILCATMQPNTIFREPGWPGKGTNHTPLACIQPGPGRPGSLVRARLCAEDNQSGPKSPRGSWDIPVVTGAARSYSMAASLHFGRVQLEHVKICMIFFWRFNH